MGRAYSQDLRERVLAAVDGGMTKMGAHQTFRVWRSTIDDWLALRAATGALVPQSPARKGPPRLLDEESFVSFAQAHRHDTLEAMALARWRLRDGACAMALARWRLRDGACVGGTNRAHGQPQHLFRHVAAHGVDI